MVFLSPSGQLLATSNPSSGSEVLRWAGNKAIYQCKYVANKCSFNNTDDLLYMSCNGDDDRKHMIIDLSQNKLIPNLFADGMSLELIFAPTGYRAYAFVGGDLAVYSTTNWELITRIPVIRSYGKEYSTIEISKAIALLLAKLKSGPGNVSPFASQNN
jgi:hypothetical protein